MDKCIKVLIPTGEVRLERDSLGNYWPAKGDDKSMLAISKFAGNRFEINPSDVDNFVGDWVFMSVDGEGMAFPVIAQYGDEFPV